MMLLLYIILIGLKVPKLKSRTKNKDETNIMLRIINLGESVGRRAIYSVDKRSILYLSIISNA